MNIETSLINSNSWEAVSEVFLEWLGDREDVLKPGLAVEPTIKVMVFLALLDLDKLCSYDDIRELLKQKKVIKGNVPDNTLRTSVLNLGKTLNKADHALELKSLRGRFQLLPRALKSTARSFSKELQDPVVLLLNPPAIEAEKVARDLIEKALLPFSALYFLEWSARWWQIFSSKEAEIRLEYEAGAWEKLGVKDRLCKRSDSDELIGVVGLAPGEGLAEIELLKKILDENSNRKVHYLAVDSSQRLLRDHIGLLKETLTPEIAKGRLICAGIIADIFCGLRDAISRVRREFTRRGTTKFETDFLPPSCGLLITYLGNCLGNNLPDQETEIFSIIHSTFQHRPLEFLVSVAAMRPVPDEYKRNWDDFLLQTPKHLLETKKLLESSGPSGKELPEFNLPPKITSSNRCLPVVPESYIVRHQIAGQIYRFYYRLAFDLKLAGSLAEEIRPLPKGTLILLYNIIKYDMETLVEGIEKCGLFKVSYNKNYHQILNTPNGQRDCAIFSAYLEKTK